jgi:hypothetical protein
MRFLTLLIIFCLPFYCFAQHWYQIDAHTSIIAPGKHAAQLQGNQAVISGTDCAAIINAHSDFAVLEQTINQIKKRLSVPVCYLISTGSAYDEILGIALLQHAFPTAKWIAPVYVKDNIQKYARSYRKKIDDYTRSLNASTQRVTSLSDQDKAHWQKKLHIAEQRINYWRSLNIPNPHNEASSISLGHNSLEITPIIAASAGDLLVFNTKNGALFGGSSLDPIPYVTHQYLSRWRDTLVILKQRNEIIWLLPSHGKPYKRAKLTKPISFLHTVIALDNPHPLSVPKSLRILYKNNVAKQQTLQLLFNLALKHTQPSKKDIISI